MSDPQKPVRLAEPSAAGFVVDEREDCPSCQGARTLIAEFASCGERVVRCWTCRGTGEVRHTQVGHA